VFIPSLGALSCLNFNEEDFIISLVFSNMNDLFKRPIMLKAESAEDRHEASRPLSAASAVTANQAGLVEFGSPKYYALCGFAGVLSCGLTHTLVTPLDLVKCRLQVDKDKYKNLGNGFKITFREAGAKGLVLGWAPTFIGYSIQGKSYNSCH